jgi:hypothetical protein
MPIRTIRARIVHWLEIIPWDDIREGAEALEAVLAKYGVYSLRIYILHPQPH